MIQTTNVPEEIRLIPQWVLWRYEDNGKVKLDKVLYQARKPAVKASHSDHTTWATFEDAIAAADQASGIGFVFAPNDFY